MFILNTEYMFYISYYRTLILVLSSINFLCFVRNKFATALPYQGKRNLVIQSIEDND
jgi:hypothetical protein